jgi:hypothetical protein
MRIYMIKKITIAMIFCIKNSLAYFLLFALLLKTNLCWIE